jgi:hypothetical protein
MALTETVKTAIAEAMLEFEADHKRRIESAGRKIADYGALVKELQEDLAESSPARLATAKSVVDRLTRAGIKIEVPTATLAMEGN